MQKRGCLRLISVNLRNCRTINGLRFGKSKLSRTRLDTYYCFHRAENFNLTTVAESYELGMKKHNIFILKRFSHGCFGSRENRHHANVYTRQSRSYIRLKNERWTHELVHYWLKDKCPYHTYKVKFTKFNLTLFFFFASEWMWWKSSCLCWVHAYERQEILSLVRFRDDEDHRRVRRVFTPYATTVLLSLSQPFFEALNSIRN